MSAHRTLATLGRCALLAFGLAAPASAQVAILPLRGLSFGVLRPGSAELVDAEDAGRRAELLLLGTGSVTITLRLPTEMVTPTGFRLPLQFKKGDAEVVTKSGEDRSWDPNKPKDIKIKAGELGAMLYLGGMALPDAAQPPGQYRATITVQVMTPGT